VERTKEIQSFLDNFAKKAFGRSPTEAKEKGGGKNDEWRR